MAPQARLGEIVEIYDGLDSDNPDAALSANMGRVLKEEHDDLADRVTALESGGGSGSDTTFTPATDAYIDALFQ